LDARATAPEDAVKPWEAPARLQRLLKGLAGINSRVAPKVAARLNERVLDCYRNEQDPYGVAWAPLKPSTIKRKRGNTVILSRSGASSRDCGARAARGAGVVVWAGGAAHQHMAPHGTRPARCVLPVRGLPPAWREDIAAECGAEFAKSFGRATR
jgi:hypothetical protein